MDGFTAARKIPFQSRFRSMQTGSFTNNVG
jgi:hypothetical protein